jgi:hypothetical protein
VKSSLFARTVRFLWVSGHSQKIFTILGAVIFFVVFASIGRASPAEDNYSVRVEEEGKRQGEGKMFGCSERIFAYLKAGGRFTVGAQVTFQWIRPDGDIQEEVRVDVMEPSLVGSEVYGWISLKGEIGPIGDFVFGGDYGERRRVFNGNWKVIVFVNGQEEAQKEFYVNCMP